MWGDFVFCCCSQHSKWPILDDSDSEGARVRTASFSSWISLLHFCMAPLTFFLQIRKECKVFGDFFFFWLFAAFKVTDFGRPWQRGCPRSNGRVRILNFAIEFLGGGANFLCKFKKSVACGVILSVLAPFGANLESFFIHSHIYIYAMFAAILLWRFSWELDQPDVYKNFGYKTRTNSREVDLVLCARWYHFAGPEFSKEG